MDLEGADSGALGVKALLWKEWREARRPFAASLLSLILLPLIVVLISRLLISDEWLFGAGTWLTIVPAPVMAATWGAHVICKEQVSSVGQFLFAQPIDPRRVLLTKLRLSVLLLIGIVTIPIAFDILGYQLTIGESMLDNAYILSSPPTSYWIAIALSYLVALFADMVVAALLAKTFSRLDVAILGGLVGSVFLLVGPLLWRSLLYLQLERSDNPYLVFQYYGGTVSLIAVLLGVVGLVLTARRTEPIRLPTRRLAWVAVIALLGGTWYVTGTLANNTVPTDEIAPGLNAEAISYGGALNQERLLWSEDDRLLWWASDGNAKQAHLMSVQIGKGGKAVGAPQRASAASERPASNEAIAGNYLYRYERVDSGYRLAVYDRSVGKSPAIAKLAIVQSPRWMPAKLDLDGSTLIVWPAFQFVDDVYVYKFDMSEPDNPVLVEQSKPLPRPETRVGRMLEDNYRRVARRGSQYAISSRVGLWIYQLNDNGTWTLLGQRHASVLEIMAGRWSDSLIWRGNYIYENSARSFGLLLFDVTDIHSPRRIAHCGGRIEDFTVLDSGVIAMVVLPETSSGAIGQFADSIRRSTIQIHKLPD